ncbi:hypothetical protein [Pseudomonas aeruginosa]|uniref:hypothetical protein n=1 Tax=Pseudomonas aeruginosa TaxID=287 RepID=UPI00073867C7|nr:hypothetical protein [Pseudomonas aeruginosa]ALU48878.1 hypothetical protein AU380_14260 [Pseudomonas aeruginosa]
MSVKSISDEELAEVERLYIGDRSRLDLTVIMRGPLADIIARLRAAEVDAKRWRHARDILTIEAIESAHCAFISFGLPPDESESIRADQAIDSAMESTP